MKKPLTLVALFLVIMSLIIIPTLLLTGCAKMIDIECETVEVTITDAHHRGAYSVPMKVGKVMTVRHVPASYNIYVEYEGVGYSFGGYETWNRYKDCIGENIPATLEIRKYDDGTIKHVITGIGEEGPND